MKGDILFEKMAGISDEYIAEAALVQTVESIPTVDVTPAPKKRFPPYLFGGLAAACVCFVVSVAALVGMVAWGLTDNSPGNTITPSAPSFPISPGAPLWQRFDFTYAVTDGEGLPLTAALPGDTVLVDTTLTNRGLPFFYSGSSSEYCAYAEFVLQGNESVTMQGGIFHTTDVGIFPVLSGEVGQGQYFFTIPENAVPGVYDLVLSYKDVKQVFSGVLTVGEPTGEHDDLTPLPLPPVDTTDHPFSFGYELPDDAKPGDVVSIPTWVINEGEEFTFRGSSNGCAPTAILVHMGTQYRIDSLVPVTGDWVTLTIQAGERKDRTQTFLIPEDAPVGVYALTLSFGGAVQSFPGVLIVTDDSTEVLPLEDGHPFAFGYNPLPLDSVLYPGYQLDIEAWVMNAGASFSFLGDPYSFIPALTLYHMDSDYSINGMPPPTGVEPGPCLVTTGQKGETTFTMRLPDDAPTGAYGLRLSYNGQEQVFENVLKVATP